ncbi:MAG: 30S ribosome-binding factor RbfA, partial [Gammaproteobacteria bacterium]|nr:30S ribosome-binding factor RbfA [Gammaproteobacteria bacterium]
KSPARLIRCSTDMSSRDFYRSSRLEEQVQRTLSDVLRSETRDPRLLKVIVTDARVTKDLSVAWVYYSLLDKDVSPEDVNEAFVKAGGFLRTRLAKELTVRRVPELRFEYDDSEIRGAELESLIDSAVAKDREHESDGDEEV